MKSNAADEKCCWLCLSAAPVLVRPCGSDSSRSGGSSSSGSGSGSGGNYQLQKLSLPCKCPTLYSHAVCLARWQVRNAGLFEEHSCRFCMSKLPKWSDAMNITEKPISTPPLADDVPTAVVDPHMKRPPVPVAMMTVKCKGKVAKIPCAPGEEGRALFLTMARSIFDISPSTPVDARFAFKESSLCNGRSADTNESIVPPDAVVALHGLKAFDTACQLASVLCNRNRRHETRHGNDLSLVRSRPHGLGSRNASVSNSMSLQSSRGADSRDLSLLVSGMEADVNHEGGTPRQGLSGSDIRPALDGDLIRGTTGQAQVSTQISQINPAHIYAENSKPHWSILKPGSWAILGCLKPVNETRP